MATGLASFIQAAVNGAGVKLQGWLNTFGTDDVLTQAVVPTDILGVPLKANGTVSTANSTAVALGAAGVFTGTAEDVSAYSSIAVAVFANQPSATDGFVIQQGPDGTNWDQTDTYTITASTGRAFIVPVHSRFMRVIYTNGATLQTAFRLQTIFHVNSKKGSSVRPQDGRTNESDLEEVSAYLSGFNGTSWDRLRSSAKGVQGAFALAVQDLKDSGRTPIVLSTAGTTAVVAATLMTMNIYKGGVITSANSYQVTAGKTFRIQAIQFGVRFITPSTTVTFASVTFALRFLTATGTLLATSPILIQDSKMAASNVPTANSDLSIPDGLEIPGGYVIGVTEAASAVTLALDVLIVGYEF